MARRKGIPAGACMASFSSAGRLPHDPCGLCGEPHEDHRAASGNSAAFCMAPASRPGDTFVASPAWHVVVDRWNGHKFIEVQLTWNGSEYVEVL